MDLIKIRGKNFGEHGLYLPNVRVRLEPRGFRPTFGGSLLANLIYCSWSLATGRGNASLEWTDTRAEADFPS